MDILKTLSEELGLRPEQVENAVSLLDAGNTIAFVARYRKEATGAMDDAALRKLSERLTYLRKLNERREEILSLIGAQDKLTPELTKKIEAASILQELEDLYRPYKQKKRTRATIAKEKGLEPLANKILLQDIEHGNPAEIAAPYVDAKKGVECAEDALLGACDIIAEIISDNADYRKLIRSTYAANGVICTRAAKEEDSVYAMYYDFSERVKSLAGHRVLAINRGEKEGYLSVSLEVDEDALLQRLNQQVITNPRSIFKGLLFDTVKDAYKRLIAPSVEREVRASLTESASEGAIKVFSKNLHSLLMQPPIRGKIVLGVDPGYRTGCKIAVIDATGKVCDTGVLYCTLPHHDREKSRATVLNLIKRYGVNLIAIGNGTASRETEQFIAEAISHLPVRVPYLIANEAGASVYSASEAGAEEFPDFTVEQRSAVSIARRVQDPLVEFVKIDPKSIGVGQYQHDMNQKRLSEALGGVVEDCVNQVGVDLNTASAALLSYVSGINTAIAKNIVKYREKNGAYQKRRQLLKVEKLGPKAFTQCAGFLRIPGGDDILDNTSVHPESYDVAKKLLDALGYTLDDVANGRVTDILNRMKTFDITAFCAKNQVGALTVSDIAAALLKPGRDPRDELPQPALRTNVMDINDLKPGMVMQGTVRNVIDFGAFVDIGVHQDGLVHISNISNAYIKHPTDVLQVGDVVAVKVMDVDVSKNRISLSIKDAQ